MKTALALLCSALALTLVAGCGSDDDEADSGGGGQGQQEPAPSGGGRAGGTSAVTMKDTAFDPKALSVKKGTTVKWTNEDSVGHDVTKTGGPSPEFKSGSPGGMKKGDSYEHAFSTPGKVSYVCTVHPGMKGSVTVK